MDCISTDGKMFGIYLGKVLMHLPHGRCKIFIPTAYPEEFKDKPELLPSASQAAPLFAGVNDGNGLFSYPNIGATVYCQFLNGDVNFPVYFAAVLGGENAFGQYENIKFDQKEINGEAYDYEKVSSKHLVTSGKARVKFFEGGKLSAIVEDPIRTICSVDYDSWEKANDNISADDKYQSSLSNDILKDIRDNKLSNIDCQIVIDNDGGTFGQLSTSTHHYNIIDDNDEKKDLKQKGTLSIDNWHKMDNNGKIQFGTLSTVDTKTERSTQKQSLSGKVENKWWLAVPGEESTIVSHSLEQKTEKQDLTRKLAEKGKSQKYLDFMADYSVDSNYTQMSSIEQGSGSTFLTAKTANNLAYDVDGLICLSSMHKVKKMVAADSTSTTESKLTAALSSLSGDTMLQTISAFSRVNDQAVFDTKIVNQLQMQKQADVVINSSLDVSRKSDDYSEAINSQSKGDFDGSVGWHLSKQKWNCIQATSNNALKIDNVHIFEVATKVDASVVEQVKSKKSDNGTPTTDFSFIKKIDAASSVFDIQINDNILKNQCISNIDCSKGAAQITITNKTTGKKCVVKIDSTGCMEIYTSDKVDVKTDNSVTVTTKDITMNSSTTTINGVTTINGATTVNSTLHVTGETTIDSSAKVAADANIGGISFLGHTHIDTYSGPTSPPS